MPRTASHRFAVCWALPGLFLITAASIGQDAATVSEAPSTRRDRHGDPLPPGAIARFGTVRLRHPGGIGGLAFTPDGKTLLSAGGNVLRWWDPATGRETRSSMALPAFPRQWSLSPNGATVAVTKGGTFCCLDLATGKLLVEMPSVSARDFYCLAFSPDGKTVIGGGSEAAWDLPLHDVVSGKELRTFRGHKGCITGVAFAADGKRLLSHSIFDQTVRVWDVATGEELFQPRPYTRVCWAGFTPDGTQVVTAGRGPIHFWDVKTHKEVHRIDTGEALTDMVAFLPHGKRLVSLSGHRERPIDPLQIRETATGRIVYQVRLPGAALSDLVISPDGKTLAVADQGQTIRLWETATLRELQPHSGHAGQVTSVNLSPDGQFLVSYATDATVCLWDVNDGRALRRWNAERGYGRAFFMPDGHAVAWWEKSNLVAADLVTGRRLPCLPDAQVYGAFAFSTDGRLLAARDANGKVSIWRWPTGELVRRHTVNKEVLGLAFAPDGKTLAAGLGLNGEVQLWDTASGKELRGWRAHPSYLLTLAFSPDGSMLATGSIDRTVRVWDVATGKELACLPGGGGSIGAVAFAPDGRALIAADHATGTVRLWETVTFQERGRFDRHGTGINALCFAPDGGSFFSASIDSTILQWDVLGPEPAAGPLDLTPRGQQAFWDNLASDDAECAYRALGTLVRHPALACALIGQRLRPTPLPEPPRLRQLLTDLNSRPFAARQQAMLELERLADGAEPALRDALKSRPPLEVQRGVERLLDRLDVRRTPERWREIRAVEALEHIATPEARQLLRDLADGEPRARLTREARAALERLARQSGGEELARRTGR